VQGCGGAALRPDIEAGADGNGSRAKISVAKKGGESRSFAQPVQRG